MPLCRLLLAAGASPICTDQIGQSALHTASGRHDPQVLAVVFEANPIPNPNPIPIPEPVPEPAPNPDPNPDKVLAVLLEAYPLPYP